MAAFLGTTVRADMVYLAFQIPHLARRLFVEGMFSGAMVPELEAAASEGREQTQRLSGSLFRLCAVGGLVTAIAGMVAAPLVVQVTQPGLMASPELKWEAIWLTRIMFGYLFFLGLAVVLRALYEHVRLFSIPASAPLVFNIGIITTMAFMIRAGVNVQWAFAFGVLGGGTLQILVMLIYVHRLPIRIRYGGTGGNAVGQVFRRMIPVGLAVAAPELYLITGRAAASFLAAGNVASLDYAMRVTEVAVGVGVLPMTMVILPMLSRHVIRKDREAMNRDTGHALQLVMTLCIPAAVGLWTLKVPITRLLFARGTFDSRSVEMTASVLGVFTFGIIAMGMYRVFCQVYFARRRTAMVVTATVAGFLVTLAGCLILTEGSGNAGVATAWVSGLWMSTIILSGGVFYGNCSIWWPFCRSVLLSVLACVPMLIVVWRFESSAADVPVLLSVLVGGTVYSAARAVLMAKEERIMWRRIVGREV